MNNTHKFTAFLESIKTTYNNDLIDVIHDGFNLCMEAGNETKTVIADKKTGNMWGGVFDINDAEGKLKRVRKKTGNDNYEIMSFDQAKKISDNSGK